MKLVLALITGFFVAGLAVIPEDAEAARRLGGARNMGAQRQVTPPPQKATPAQQQAAPANSSQANAAAAQQPARNRWMGPLAGLAAGLGLGWLISQGGFGALLSALLLALVVGVAVFALLRLFARRNEPARPMQYAAAGRTDTAVPPRMPLAEAGGGAAAAAAAPANVPAGFDVPGFVKQARLNFMRLQQANDQADLVALREVTTEEMFQALSGDLSSRGGVKQQTEISGLEAQLLEVTTDAEYHWASISFDGLVREEGSSSTTPFQEIWHLRKPVNGDSGWLLAGIQQPS